MRIDAPNPDWRSYAADQLRRAEVAEAALKRVRTLALKPHVVPVHTLDGMENAPVAWPHEILAATSDVTIREEEN